MRWLSTALVLGVLALAPGGCMRASLEGVPMKSAGMDADTAEDAVAPGDAERENRAPPAAQETVYQSGGRSGGLRVEPGSEVEIIVDPAGRVLGSYDVVISVEEGGESLALSDAFAAGGSYFGAPNTNARSGRIRLVYAHTDENAPPGPARVARVLLLPLAPGEATLNVRLRTATDVRGEIIPNATALLSRYRFKVLGEQ